MSTYKSLPQAKDKKNHLPFYRPIDHLIFFILKQKKIFLSLLVVFFLFLCINTGYGLYHNHYEELASLLLDKDDLMVVVNHYPNSKAADVARVKLGTKALHEKKYDEAMRWYEPVSKRGEAMLRIGALQNMALASLKKGDTASSIKTLEKVISDKENIFQDYSRLILARVYESQGDKEKAHEIYQKLSEGTSEGMGEVREEAKFRLSWLNKEQK